MTLDLIDAKNIAKNLLQINAIKLNSKAHSFGQAVGNLQYIVIIESFYPIPKQDHL